MKIKDIIAGVIEREGGYSENPDDPGGPTKFGIGSATARRNGYRGQMRDLPRPFAEAVYLREYVTEPGFDQVGAVSMAIAEELVDTGVNMGVSIPLPWLQRVLNVLNQQGKLWADIAVDGKIGPATLGALGAYLRHRGRDDGERVMLRALNCLQGARYIELAESRAANETFVYGWLLNRVEVA